MTIQQGTVDDLKAVFLAVHNSAITTTIPEVAAQLKMKRQYVKELIGVLGNLKDESGDALVIVNAEPGENGNDEPHTWYQTGLTLDYETAEEAEARFGRAVEATGFKPLTEAKQTSAPRTPRNATNPADLPMCLCGCKNPVNNRNRNYRPGHDARHAGDMARHIAKHDPPQEDRDTLLGMLPTPALQKKADDMATRLLRKAAAKTRPARKQLEEQGKSTKEIEKVVDYEGTVKVGRYELRAVQDSKSGAVVYFTKDNEHRPASERIAKTFKLAQ